MSDPKDPVLVARSHLANATKNGGDVAAARADLAEAKLHRAIGEALAHFPPLAESAKADAARLLIGGPR